MRSTLFGRDRRPADGSSEVVDLGTGARGRKGVVVASAAAVGVGVVVVGAVAAYRFGVFGAPGAQPSSVVPGNAFAYAALDFDPSAKEKIAAFQLARKFPGAHVTSADGVKDALVDDALGDDPSLDYDRDVKPWLGDRVAVAALPGSGRSPVTPLVVLACSDKDAARADLGRLRRQDPRAFAFAFKDDYALLAETQRTVDAAASATTSLEDDTAFAHDMDALGGDQLGRAWMDVTPHDLAAMASAGGFDRAIAKFPAIRAALGVHVSGSSLEVEGTTSTTQASSTTPSGGPAALTAALPADSDVAAEATGLGPAFTAAWPQLAELARTFGVTAQAAQVGLHLPDDVAALLGDDLAVAARVPATPSGTPDVLVTGRSADPAAAQAAAEKLVPLLRPDLPALALRPTADGYALSNAPTWSDPAGGGLGDSAAFREAVPHAATANALLYVDIAAFVDLATADPDPNLTPLQAAGLSVESHGTEGRFTLRITTK